MSDRIEMLQGRLKRCCCKDCGSDLVLQRVTYSVDEAERLEIYCPQCKKIEFGVEREIYAAAKYFIDALSEPCAWDAVDQKKMRDKNVAKTAEIMAWGFSQLGVVGENGWNFPVNQNLQDLQEELQILDSDLPDDWKERGIYEAAN